MGAHRRRRRRPPFVAVALDEFAAVVDLARRHHPAVVAADVCRDYGLRLADYDDLSAGEWAVFVAGLAPHSRVMTAEAARRQPATVPDGGHTRAARRRATAPHTPETPEEAERAVARHGGAVIRE